MVIYQSNINYIRASVNSVLQQTYKNTELILIDHATSGGIARFLSDVLESDAHVKLIRLSDHEWDPTKSIFDDRVYNLWNAGLLVSEGDFIFNLSWDDLLSENFSQAMVCLFTENPMCTSAAPAIVSIDSNGFLNYEVTARLMNGNRRHRYTSGLVLAESYMSSGSLISFPGQILVLRTTEVLRLGGFEGMIDLSQLFKCAIFGISGYDPRAILRWRHHSEQGNRKQTKLGLVYYKDHFDYYENYNIRELHKENFGADFQNRFLSFFKKRAISGVCDSIYHSFFMYGFRSGTISVRRAFVEMQLGVFASIAPKIVFIITRFAIQHSFVRLKSLIRSVLKFDILVVLVRRITLDQLRSTNYVNPREEEVSGYRSTYTKQEFLTSPKASRLYDLLGEISSKLGSYNGVAPRQGVHPEGYMPVFYDYNDYYLLTTAIADSMSPERVIEIGTGAGKALWGFLSSQKVQYLVTYDITPSLSDRSLFAADLDWDVVHCLIDNDSRWEQRIGDLADTVFFESQVGIIEDAALIFVDGPSDGIFEQNLLDNILKLRNRNEIMLVFNHIRIPPMVSFWFELKLPKIDISGIGKQLGTGLALLAPYKERIYFPSP